MSSSTTTKDLTPEPRQVLTDALYGFNRVSPDVRAMLVERLAPVVAQMLADERERIAKAIEALPEHDGAGWPNKAYEIKEDAAVIARGGAA